MRKVCLSIIAPCYNEQEIEDFILQSDHVFTGFSSFELYGHGKFETLDTMGEKVEGHAKRVRFDIILTESTYVQALTMLKSKFKSINIFYWVTPLIDVGVFNE